MVQVTLRIKDELGDWLLSKNKACSQQVRIELTRFYKLLKKYRFEQFNKDELLLFCEVFNGTSFEFEIDLKFYFLAEIKSAIQWDNLATKYDLNCDELFQKIEAMDAIEIIALISKIEQFWHDETYNFDSQEKLKKVLAKYGKPKQTR
jgi:hypothetical protein